MEEIWKDIIGYEGYYQISNLGRVKFLERKSTNKFGPRSYKEKIVKQHIGKRGYYTVDLVVKKIKKTKSTHRLIAIHFIDNPTNKKQVNHIDKNPLNNEISNLEWVSNLENMCHAYKHKKTSSKYIGVGWDKHHGKWKCQIYFKGKSRHIGVFNTEEEAYLARIKFEKENNIQNKYL